MSIAELSLKRPVTTVMLFVSMFVVGLIAAIRLPLEALPDVSAPFLFVQMPYAGSTPEEVEREILRPTEEALATMPGIKRMEGRARSDGASAPIRSLRRAAHAGPPSTRPSPARPPSPGSVAMCSTL